MLKDAEFKSVYASGENEPAEFFLEALINSNTFDLGLGYFSSSGFRALAIGFAYFISQGGKMRIIINNILNEEDKRAILEGQNQKVIDNIEETLIDDVLELKETLSKNDKHFFNCLSWLIATNRLEIKATVPKKNQVGIVHQKFGIFQDHDNNRLAFTGSVNFSAYAIFNNVESLWCDFSWTNHLTSQERIKHFETIFSKTWDGLSDVAEIIPLEKVKTSICKEFPVESLEILLEEEGQLVKDTITYEKVAKKLNFKFEQYLTKLEIATSKLQLPTNIRIHSYQLMAYQNWKNKKCSGIFAMATGTGKTITAINCVYEEYLSAFRNNPKANYYLLILVPTQPLLHQWVDELLSWQFNSIYTVSGESNWRKSLLELANDFQFGVDSNFVIVSTYRSFTHINFQKILHQLPKDTILIADEAHNLGQSQVRELLPSIPFKKRIGLSATPKRVYDIEGTTQIEEFFNDQEPYCFSFYMEQAIETEKLCRYEYYPKLVELEPDELEEYVNLSMRISRLAHFANDNSEKQSLYERLLLKRKRIINKAKGKLSVLAKIIRQITKEHELKYCFTYAPEGEWDNYDSRILKDNVRIISEMQKVFEDEIPGLRTHTYLGETEAREEVLQGFEDGKIDVLLAIKCLDEGINVPRTSIGIFTSSTGNPRQYIQRRGRVLRTHKDKSRALIYDMVVIPKVFGEKENTEFFNIQRNLVRNELMRVGYFAKLSENFYDAKEELEDVIKFYGLDLDTIIKELEQ